MYFFLVSNDIDLWRAGDNPLYYILAALHLRTLAVLEYVCLWVLSYGDWRGRIFLFSRSTGIVSILLRIIYYNYNYCRDYDYRRF